MKSLDCKLCKSTETMPYSYVYYHIVWYIISAQLVNKSSYSIKDFIKNNIVEITHIMKYKLNTH